MNQYKVIIVCILGASFQHFGCLKILDMVHFYAYHILTEGVTLLLIKIYGYLEITWNIYSIIVFGGMYLSLLKQ